MANQREIEAVYDWLDLFQELRLGKFSDLSAALFDGDFSKTLEQAQIDKHNWVMAGVGVSHPGQRILDIGCGWGPILAFARERGVSGLGLTLSRAQAAYCRRAGLNVEILDWKDADTRTLGQFNAVVSLGAFEHFCSEEQFKSGEQSGVYQRFFGLCADVLPPGGRLYLQTMTWGSRVPIPEKIRLNAPEGSPERILARLRKFYPGSWLPSGRQQIVEIASPRFKLIGSNNGRKDYIETLNRWGDANRRLWSFPKLPRTVVQVARLLPRYFANKDFRIQIESARRNDQQRCFIDDIMNHERLFFERL